MQEMHLSAYFAEIRLANLRHVTCLYAATHVQCKKTTVGVKS